MHCLFACKEKTESLTKVQWGRTKVCKERSESLRDVQYERTVQGRQ